MKIDPSDFSRSDLEQILRAPFPTSLEAAREDGLPEPDYFAGGEPFWWGTTIIRWRDEMFEVTEARVAAHEELIKANAARLRADYERREDDEGKARAAARTPEAMMQNALNAAGVRQPDSVHEDFVDHKTFVAALNAYPPAGQDDSSETEDPPRTGDAP